MGAKEEGGRKHETKQAKQPINHLWAQQGRAGRGQGMWGRNGGAARPEGAGGLRLLLYYQSPQLRRHPPPCIDYDLGPAHMFRAVIRRGPACSIIALDF